jgi:hypothetical protein
MRGLTSSELLGVWERAWSQPSPHRAMVLLAAAHPQVPAAELEGRTVGERETALLDLYESTFGPDLAGVVACPGCGERLEVSLHRQELGSPVGADQGPVPADALVVRRDEYEVRFRLPTAGDLVAVANRPDPDAARTALLERCTGSASRDGQAVAPGELPGPVAEAVAEAMAQADPAADPRLDLTCPSCGHRWQSSFDPASFLWDTVDAWARRTLREVHALALAYGWAEADILAMTARRRRLYLETAGAV